MQARAEHEHRRVRTTCDRGRSSGAAASVARVSSPRSGARRGPRTPVSVSAGHCPSAAPEMGVPEALRCRHDGAHEPTARRLPHSSTSPEDRKDEFLEVDRLAFAFDSHAGDRRARADHPHVGPRRMAVEDARRRARRRARARSRSRLPVPGDDDRVLGPDLGGRPTGPAPPRPAARDDRHALRAVAGPRRARVGAVRRGARDLRPVRVRLGRRRRAREARRAAPRCGTSPGSEALTVALRRPSTSTRHTRGRRRASTAPPAPGRPGWITRDTDVLRARARSSTRPPGARAASRCASSTVRDAAGERAGLRAVAAQGELGGGRPGRRPSRSARPSRVDAAADAPAVVVPARPRPHGDRRGPDARPSTTRCCTCSSTRAAAVPKVNDNLWVRLLDLPVALAGRRYAAPVDVVLDVTDARLPANAGRWRLTHRRPRRRTARTPADGRRGPTTTADLRARRARARRRLPRRPVARGAGRARGWSPSGRPARCSATAAAFAWPRRAGVQLASGRASGRPRTPSSRSIRRWWRGSLAERLGDERVDERERLVDGVLPRADRDDVRVVVLAAQLRGRRGSTRARRARRSTLFAAICSPLPEPPMTTPSEPGSATTASPAAKQNGG